MSHVRQIQSWLRSADIAGLVIPSTDEFLSEFAPPASRHLSWATGFGGSTGVAVILRDTAAIFLDSRYVLQGTADTTGTGIAIEAATLASRRGWLKRSLAPGARLGLNPWLHSMLEMEQWRGLAVECGFQLQMLTENPIDSLWAEGRPSEFRPRIVDYPVRYAGQSSRVKCADLIEYVKAAELQGLLLADPEDVSWLLNVRAESEAVKTEVGDWHVVPSCTSRALVQRDGSVTWFVDESRLMSDVTACRRGVTVASPDTLGVVLREAARLGPIGTDPRRTPVALATILEEEGKFRADDTVARRRWCKHITEVQSARRAHIVDAVAVVRFMAWLTRTVPTRTISEFEAAEMLQALRAEYSDFIGPSMPLMSASGPSGAQPHYVPRRHACRNLNDHPIFWMDSGGQYLGGSTDNTITLALGAPEPKHILAHTLVVQGFIALAMTRVPVGTAALRLDTIARQALWQEGMDYGHGTGHGVGNYLNIHEGPVITRDPGPLTTVPIEVGMIVSNEPGYYAESDFGVRIESHMVVVESRHPGFVEFETISRLPIDPRLVDFERLSPSERRWLADYHRNVLSDLEPLLDAESAAWLRSVARSFR